MSLVDENERRRALLDFDSLLLVEAAAGTGKTSIIAGRVALMLADGRPPHEIAAITFTDLAAGQLAQRIEAIVHALLDGEIPLVLRPALPEGLSSARRAALTSAADHLDDLTATTIHGFCQAFIRSHGVEAGLDPGARVVDEPVADGLFFEELSKWFSCRLAETADPNDPVAILSRHAPRKVVRLMRELAKLRRDHPAARTVPPTVGARPDIDFVQAVDDFAHWHARSAGDSRNADIGAELRRLGKQYEQAFATQPNFGTLWRLGNPARSRLMRKDAVDLLPYGDALDAFGAFEVENLPAQGQLLYAEVDRAWRIMLGHIARTMVASVSASLDDMLAGYAARKKAAAVLDFDDLLAHARTLIRDHEAVGQALRRRYRYLLVDEFQDTDPIQADIIFSLAAETRSSHWCKALLRPGSLFLVGDPKQAIYRFRGADIETYTLAKGTIAAQSRGAVLEITANFRSQNGIIKYINGCFERVLSKKGQSGYVALAATIPDEPIGRSRVTRVTIEVGEQASANELREAEAERVAEICASLIGNVSVKRANGANSPIRAEDIALLSPAHGELRRYERALERWRIPVASEAGRTLMHRQETQDILALLRVLADPRDTLAFGALMRGPLVGLTDQELLDITFALPQRDDGKPATFTLLAAPTELTHPIARSMLEALQTLRRRAMTTTPSILLAEAIETLHLRVALAYRHQHRNSRALANIDAIIERARAYGVTGLKAFVRDLNSDWERKALVAEGRVNATEDAVAILTMHGAKGLEWPVVIPINSATRFKNPDEFVHRRSDGTLHWMLGDIAPPDLAAAQAEENDEVSRERERIWYVTCTRARNLLIVPHVAQAVKRSWHNVLELGQRDLPELDLSEFPPSRQAPVTNDANQQTAEVFRSEQEAVAASAPAIVWKRPSHDDRDRLKDYLIPVVVVETFGERIEAVAGGAARGIILHKLMEELLTGELADDAGKVRDRSAELLDQLAIAAPDDMPMLDTLELATTALRTMGLLDIAKFKGRIIPEVSVWSANGQDYLAGRADAVVVEDQEITIVFDWKSDIDPSPAIRAIYLRQLLYYLHAVAAPRGALVFMSLGEVVWLENDLASSPPGRRITKAPERLGIR